MRFKSLTIYTSKIEEQAAFYTKTLGFQLLNKSDKAFSFKAGETVLNVVFRKETQPYHYAFNIPSDAIALALDWLSKRVEVLSYKNELIQDFESWKAQAIYFYDCDKNIVEFIAREKMPAHTSNNFSAAAILSLSEMGIVTEQFAALLQQIKQDISLPVFSESSARFCALGNDQGLFICIDKNERDWFPKGDPAFAADFQLVLDWQDQSFALKYENSKLSIEPLTSS